jgi:hypothetical protein
MKERMPSTEIDALEIYSMGWAMLGWWVQSYMSKHCGSGSLSALKGGKRGPK